MSDRIYDPPEARNFRVLRCMYGLTQEQMAEMLCISRSTYSAIENGTQAMSYSVACAAAKFFSVHAEDFSDPNLIKVIGAASARR
ncbi:MAG: helix-turn-helix transcriptional regulator [Eubacterium sp.]|jgi:DNA-binding XRE family transcriptional regulator